MTSGTVDYKGVLWVVDERLNLWNIAPGGHVAVFDVRHSYARLFERNGFTIVKK